MKLKTNTLYITSAIPASGKSTFFKRNIKAGNIEKNMVVSSDAIRKMILGTQHSHRDGLSTHIPGNADESVFHIMRTIVEEKVKEGLTIFIDAVNPSDKERKEWVGIAKKYDFDVEVLISKPNLERSLQLDSDRKTSVGKEVVIDFFERFQEDSKYPYRIVNFEEDPMIKLTPRFTIERDNIDVIGDVHGMYEELELLLNKLNYFIEDGVIRHPKNRKCLFVGDIVDRGRDSIKVLKLVRDSVVKNGHFFIKGNHEVKLIRNMNYFKKEETQNIRGSESVLRTFMEISQDQDFEKLYKFLTTPKYTAPYYIINDEFAVIHAHVEHFDPCTTTYSKMNYGVPKIKCADQSYVKLYHLGYNQYKLIRGHIKPTQGETNDIVNVLEDGAADGGKLKGFSIDEKKFISVNSGFIYEKFRENNTLNGSIRNLLKDKLVSFNTDDTGLLNIFKYSKAVFYKNLWSQDPMLVRTRGLVLDLSGGIVQHPFTKVFNYRENRTGLDIDHDKEVVEVDKLNGFLACITKHPFKNNELLITTTGSFNSDFVGYIKDFITPKIKGQLLKFFSKNNLTLMFEVIHPDDPHIIQYKKDMHGLHLIGARGKNVNDRELSEDELDSIGEEIQFRRASWRKTTFGKVIDKVKKSNIEGYMVRDADTNEVLLKFKTPYYLTTKFLGRLSDGNIKFMYKAPKKFKERIDEEFYEIVDLIIDSVNEDSLISMNKNERTSFVRDLIDNIF